MIKYTSITYIHLFFIFQGVSYLYPASYQEGIAPLATRQDHLFYRI